MELDQERDESGRVDELKAKVLAALQDPGLLRLTVFAVIALVGAGAAGGFLLGSIGSLEAKIDGQLTRRARIERIETARRQMQRYEKTLPAHGDLNWWIAHLLEGSRKVGLRVVEYRPRKPAGKGGKIGKYQGMILQLKTVGTVQNLLDYLEWMEYNEYSNRVIHFRISPEPGSHAISGELTVAVLTNGSQAKDDSR